jgi:hypothetical protein
METELEINWKKNATSDYPEGETERGRIIYEPG